MSAGLPSRDDGRPDWQSVVRDILEEARKRAGKGPVLAIRLEESGVHGDGGARYSESAISNWIKGRSMPPAHVLLAAAHIADISIDERLATRLAAQAGDTAAALQLQELEARVDGLEKRIANFMEVVRRLQTAVNTNTQALEELGRDLSSRESRRRTEPEGR